MTRFEKQIKKLERKVEKELRTDRIITSYYTVGMLDNSDRFIKEDDSTFNLKDIERFSEVCYKKCKELNTFIDTDSLFVQIDFYLNKNKLKLVDFMKILQNRKKDKDKYNELVNFVCTNEEEFD